MSGVFRSGLTVLGFFVLVYFIHASVNSLSEINLLTGKHEKTFLEQQRRFKRAAASEGEFQYGSMTLSEPVLIKKCCNKSEFLTTDLSCIPRNVIDAHDFFPSNIMVDSTFFPNSFQEVKVVYGKHACSDEVLVVTNEDIQNHVITESSELLRLTDSGLVAFNYSTNYCIDKLGSNSYMLLKCPCQDHLCIQKCCTHNEYYDLNLKYCAKLTHLHGVETEQLNKQLNSTRKPYLVHRPLNCAKLFLNLTETIFVEPNETLVHQGGTVISHPGNYCLDVFIDGKNITQFNGFYCQNVKQKRHTSSNLNKCCREGESLNKYYQCRLKTSSTVTWRPNSTFTVDRFTSFAFKNFKVPDDTLAIHLKKNDYVLHVRDKMEQKLFITDILKYYSADVFCLDEYQDWDSEFALIFSPCQKNMCLQKCCSYGSIFNLTSYKCQTTVDQSIGIDLIAMNSSNTTGEVGEYFLINKEPNCGFYKLIHPNLMGAIRIFLQKNGNIPKRIERTRIKWVQPSRYCIDTFLQGHIRMSNGFFCYKSRQAKRGWNISPDHRDNNGNLSQYSSPHVLFSAFILIVFMDNLPISMSSSIIYVLNVT